MGITVLSSESCVKCHVIIWILCVLTSALLPVSGVLETTPAAVNGRLSTCAGQPISLTCTHTNTETGRTTWRFSPPIDCSRSLLHDPVPDNIDDCGPFSFEGVTQLTTGVTQLSSTAVATVSSQHTGTLVECSDKSSVSMTNIGNVSLCVVDEPTISQAVNTTDGVEITWTSGCTSGVKYMVAVTRQGDAPDNITFSSVLIGSTSVVADNLTDGQDYTVYVTASIESCNTPTAQRNFKANRSAGPGGDSVGAGKNLGAIIAPVVIVAVLVIAIIGLVIAIVFFCHKKLKSNGTKRHSTEVPNPDTSYTAVKFDKPSKGKPSPVKDNNKVAYSEIRPHGQDVTVESDKVQDINNQQQPTSTSEEPSWSQQGHSTTTTSANTPVTTSTLTGSQYQNTQAGGSVGQPSRQTPTIGMYGQTSAERGNASRTGGSHSTRPIVTPRSYHDHGDNPSSIHQDISYNRKPSHDGSTGRRTTTHNSGEQERSERIVTRGPPGGTSAYNRGGVGESSLTRSTGGGGHAADRRDKGTFGSSQPRNTGHNTTGRNYY